MIVLVGSLEGVLGQTREGHHRLLTLRGRQVVKVPKIRPQSYPYLLWDPFLRPPYDICDRVLVVCTEGLEVGR